MIDGTGAEHVTVHWEVKPAYTNGFSICYKNGKTDEKTQDQVQTDWGRSEDFTG